MSRVTYEWCCELVHIESGDRDNLNHQDTFAEALRATSTTPDEGYTYEIALWRSTWHRDDPNELIGIEYAYLTTADGRDWQLGASLDGACLPETFDCSDIKVPKRFQDEVEKAIKARSKVAA